MTEQPATPRQLRYIQALARELEMGAVELDDLSIKHYGTRAHMLSRKDASELIDTLGTLYQKKNDE